MYCSECGKQIPDDSMFCPECGIKQENVSTPNVAQEEPIMQNNKMKFCVNCGCQMSVDSRFCPNCRTRQEDVLPMQNPQPKMDRQPTIKALLSPEEEMKLKKRNKIIGITVGIALALCLVIGVLSSIIKPSINLNNYLTITFEGYDTIGKAIVQFNRKKFESDYEKKLNAKTGKKSNNPSKYKSKETYLESLFESYDSSSVSGSFLSNCVNGSLDKDSGLSNGDILTYSWDCNNEYALETYGYKLKYKDIKVEVKDLEETMTFDPFDGIDVVFEGIDPNGSASIEESPETLAVSDLNYEIDKRSGLSNGDTVTVTVTAYYYDDPINYCIENYGMIPFPIEKTYKVDGLNSYIATISEVSDNSLAEMKKQAKDVYNAGVAQNWSDDEELKSFDYIGNYLLVNKNSDYYGGSNNALYLVYKAKVKDKYSNDGKTYNETNDIYWYICFYNLLVDTDGETTVDIANYRTPGDRFMIDSGISSGWWSTKSWYYYGYQTLDELYKVVVTSNSESYKHEDNVDESVVPAQEKKPEEEEEFSGEEGIIFANSSEQELSDDAIETLSDKELRYAINELYARHGYIFKDEKLGEFYSKYDWYEGTVKSYDFTMDLFNDVETKNIEALQKERDSRN